MACAVPDEDVSDTMLWTFDEPVGTLHIYEDFLEAQIGGVISAAAVTLSRFLLQRPELVRGKRCLELGSGCGMVSMVASKLEAASIQPTEVEGTIPHLESNLKLNKIDCETKSLWWGNKAQEAALDKYDIGFAAYCLYHHEVVDVFTSLLAAQESIFLVCGLPEISENKTLEETVLYAWLKECERQQLNLYLLSVDDIDPFTKKEESMQITKDNTTTLNDNHKSNENDQENVASNKIIPSKDKKMMSDNLLNDRIGKILNDTSLTTHQLCGGVWYVTKQSIPPSYPALLTIRNTVKYTVIC